MAPSQNCKKKKNPPAIGCTKQKDLLPIHSNKLLKIYQFMYLKEDSIIGVKRFANEHTMNDSMV